MCYLVIDCFTEDELEVLKNEKVRKTFEDLTASGHRQKAKSHLGFYVYLRNAHETNFIHYQKGKDRLCQLRLSEVRVRLAG
jgi:hypothetical protein